MAGRTALKKQERTVSLLKREIDAGIKKYGKAVKSIGESLKDYANAEHAYNKRQNAKKVAAYDKAVEKLRREYTALVEKKRAINALIAQLEATVSAMAELLSRGRAKKEAKLLSRFKDKKRKQIIELERPLAGKIPTFLTAAAQTANTSIDKVEPEEEESVDNEVCEQSANEPEAQPILAGQNAKATVASVNVAPVTIDVTPIVERAIAATVDKLRLGMDKRIADYVSGVQLPELKSVSVSAAPMVSGAAQELEEHILGEEKHVLEKLSAMCESLKTLLAGISSLSEAYMAISEKQRELAEAQKQTNDMQRHTMREQQGIQVNQRVVNKEQIELTAEQTLIIDEQRAALNKQNSIADAQRAVADGQAAIVETQNALEEAMKSVMQSQKEIIETEKLIIQGNTKNTDAQRALMEKQDEISRVQKETAAAQKLLLKDQRAIYDRQKEAASVQDELKKQTKPKTRTATAAKKPAAPKADTAENKPEVVTSTTVDKPQPEKKNDVKELATDEFK